MKLKCRRKSNLVKWVISVQLAMVLIVILKVTNIKSKQRVKERVLTLEKIDNECPFENIQCKRERTLPLKIERHIKHANDNGFESLSSTIKAQSQIFEKENIEISDENESNLETSELSGKHRPNQLSNIPPIEETLTYFRNTLEIDGKQIEVNTDELQYISAHDTENIIIQATKWLTINDTEKDDRLNRHKFYYHLNSKLCSKKNTPIVILVHSAVKHARKRRLIRSTWGAVKTRVSQPTIIFMLGEPFPENKTLQLEIEKESQKHGDIVQGDFLDTYKNLTYKHVMAIHWLTSHCADVRTIVKIDDDVFVDVHKLANFSAAYGSIQNSVYCMVLRDRVQRYGKWAVTEIEYPFYRFPLYCSGAAYIISMDVARKLDKASTELGFFWIDDAYITGFVRRVAQVDIQQLKPGHRMVIAYSKISKPTKNNLKSFMFLTGKLDWDLLNKVLFNDAR